MFLEQLRHPSGHSRVNRSGAIGVNAYTLAGLGESILNESHHDADPNLHGVAVKGLDEKTIHSIAMLGGVVGHFKHHSGVLVNDPQSFRTFHATPGILGRGAQTFLPKEVVAELTCAPIEPEFG